MTKSMPGSKTQGQCLPIKLLKAVNLTKSSKKKPELSSIFFYLAAFDKILQCPENST